MQSVDEDADASISAHSDTDVQMAARLETVIASTLAEVERAHEERTDDLARIAGDLLDAEIALHQAALDRLVAARDRLDSRNDAPEGDAPATEMPESLRPLKSSSPLPQPSAWAADASSPSLIQRPLSVVGSLIGLRPW